MRFFRLSKEAVILWVYWLRHGQEEHFAREFGKKLRVLFEDLGPTFLKLGQVLSMRSDFLPKVVCEELENCLDSASPLPFEVLRPSIEAALPHSIEETFSELDEEPLASASISQVHRARLVTGEDVVVKVLRPGVRKLIVSDCRVLSVFARLVDRFGSYDFLDSTELVRLTRFWLLQEVDYRKELKNMQTMSTKLSDIPSVNVPKAYPKLSGKHVLVMEYIKGYSMIELIRKDRLGELPDFSFSMEDKLVLLMQSFLAMVIKKGYFHADMHPANIILTDEGEYYFLDFGLIDYFDPHVRSAVELFFLGIAIGSPDVVYRSSIKIANGKFTDNFDKDAFYREVSRATDSYHNSTVSAVSHGALLVHIVAAGIEYGVRMPWTVTLFARSAADIDGIVLNLAPDMAAPKHMKDFMIKLYLDSKRKEAMSFSSLVETFDTLFDTAKKSPAALEALAEKIVRGTDMHPESGGKIRQLTKEDLV